MQMGGSVRVGMIMCKAVDTLIQYHNIRNRLYVTESHNLYYVKYSNMILTSLLNL